MCGHILVTDWTTSSQYETVRMHVCVSLCAILYQSRNSVCVCVCVKQNCSQIRSSSQCLYNCLFNIRRLKESIVLFIELSVKPAQHREEDRTFNSYFTSYNMHRWQLLMCIMQPMKNEKTVTKGSPTIESIKETKRKNKACKIGPWHGAKNLIRHDNEVRMPTPRAAMLHLGDTPSVKGVHLWLIIYQRIKT